MTSTTASQVTKLGTIMGLWAHPDDETFASAGLLTMAAAAGQTVVCVTATKGEAGVQDSDTWPAMQLGEIRARELAAALDILAIGGRHHWLDLADGACREASEDMVLSKLKSLLERYRPDTIVTFAPDGMTGHPDHQAVSGWAQALVTAADWPILLLYVVTTSEAYDHYLKDMDEKFNIFFNVEQPHVVAEHSCDLALRLPPDIVQKKYLALEAMPSQTAAMLAAYPKSYLCEAFSIEGFVDAAHFTNS